ncbi:MAG TPA: SDR family oxidoreductase [Steroidobacteraceae bacterium]|jgi:NAD(P)-dependent dehydrogenase (short-subunit alcohol dehydrogenase family)|nr:SDR family oxidoreductase [Steroidobacteraceae bacterium]
MDLELRDKWALVTGSTAGIGHAIAAALVREGAHVIVNGRTGEAVDAAVALLRTSSGGTAVGFAGDLSRDADAQALVRRHPGIDILVNNLGIYEVKSFEEITDADWLRLFEVNVLSGVRLARLVLPRMRSRGWGRIIFISSESAYHIPGEMIHYGMTKAAQIAVSRGLAEVTAGSGITVNTVLPGPTRSRGVEEFVSQMAAASGKTARGIEQEFFQTARPTSLIKRFATPEEVASMVVYVASPVASATTGAVLRVDGGVVKSAF